MIERDSHRIGNIDNMNIRDESSDDVSSFRDANSVIDEILGESIRTIENHAIDGRQGCLVGECIKAGHPTLRGRILVRWMDAAGKEHDHWLPTLQNLPIRTADRVIMVKPANWNEMLVTGVIDGFANRPDIQRKASAKLKLEHDETIQVTDPGGEALFELFQTQKGAVVRFLRKDVNIEWPGKLSLKAESIELKADAGPVDIKASDDVRIKGEVIHLNS